MKISKAQVPEITCVDVLSFQHCINMMSSSTTPAVNCCPCYDEVLKVNLYPNSRIINYCVPYYQQFWRELYASVLDSKTFSKMCQKVALTTNLFHYLERYHPSEHDIILKKDTKQACMYCTYKSNVYICYEWNVVLSDKIYSKQRCLHS